MSAKKRKILIITAIILVLFASLYTALRFRCDKCWKPVKITVSTTHKKENPLINPDGATQETRILTPDGYTRVPAEKDSFLSFMREYPVYPDGSDIYVYDGSTLSGNTAAAVYKIALGNEGYQQCADSVIRLWSEYFLQTGQENRLSFHLTNGFVCDYSHFKKGLRVLAVGEKAVWLPLKMPSDDKQTFNDYLLSVMRYAGTLSLTDESSTISADEVHAGDIICHGGSPGHVVLIVDEAENADGKRCFLLAQGYIPAQSCHIIYNQPDKNPWITEEMLSADTINTGSYTFDKSELRRWGEGF